MCETKNCDGGQRQKLRFCARGLLNTYGNFIVTNVIIVVDYGANRATERFA